MKVKGLFCIMLVALLLLSCCAFSSSAAMTAPEGAIEYELYGCDYKVLITPQGSPSSFNATSRVPQRLTYAQQVVSYSLTEWADLKGYVTIDIDLGTKIVPDHEYNIIYRFGQAYSADIKESMSINVYRADGSLYKTIPINEWTAAHWHTGLDNGVDSLQEVNLNFIIQRSYLPESGYSIKLSIDFQTFLPSGSTVGQLLYTSRYMYLTDLDDDTGLLERIISAIKAIPNSIKEFFSSLGDRISGFFTDLAQSIGGWFADLKAKIQQISDNIKQWFIDLGTKIGDFFTMLKNYLLYFQHPVTVNSDGVLIGKNGKPVYTNPFDAAIDKVETTINGWLKTVSDFVDSLETSRQNVTEYLNNGSTFINGVLKASPILTACIVFAVGFLVIRKVVGR